ncbi:MAG: HAD hydrolase-like protein [Actinomycetota bacterium]|nr:HAD hydrolase-like protein [Actinomycetota bacterium]
MTGRAGPEALPHVLVFDLDDTLVPQRAWLAAAAGRVASATERAGYATQAAMQRAMSAQLRAGSDRPGVIDRALATARPDPPLPIPTGLVASLVEEFMATRVPGLACYEGAHALLRGLRARGDRVGILTDGRPDTQRGKAADAGLLDLVDALLVTDDLGGRSMRKPNPAGLTELLSRLGCTDPSDALVVGDRPGKDTAVARTVGTRAWRVLSGEYSTDPDEPAADLVLPSLRAVGERLGVRS